ncbi:MAG: hypothetical protein ACJA08_001378 [Cyclobacteriaceae bacterium]|jgi:hypothetical protein
MKSLFLIALACTFLFSSCAKKEVTNPREKTYYLHRANLNPVSGKAVFTEIFPGKLQVSISLVNTSPNITHPAHLHFGSVREVGELAFALNPVDGKTGKSVTILDQVPLSSGDILSYELLNEMNGSVKIHMNDTFFSHMVLAFGNIGKNEDYFFDGVAVCTGH